MWQDGLMYEWQNGGQPHAEQGPRDGKSRFLLPGHQTHPQIVKSRAPVF